MIICLCAGATEKHVKKCIDEGCNSLKELRNKHHICAHCKMCCKQLRDILDNQKD